MPAVIELERPLREIVDHEITGDGVDSPGLRNNARPRANDDAELDLPVHFARTTRDDEVIERPAAAEVAFKKTMGSLGIAERFLSHDRDS